MFGEGSFVKQQNNMRVAQALKSGGPIVELIADGKQKFYSIATREDCEQVW